MITKNSIATAITLAHQAHQDDWGWGDHLRGVLRDHLPALHHQAREAREAWEAWEASQEELGYWAPLSEEGAALFTECCEAESFARACERLLREVTIQWPTTPLFAGEEWVLSWGADEWSRLRENRRREWANLFGEETPSPF